jgi:CheY-like chemotaxis protein
MFPAFFSILVAAGNDALRQSLLHRLTPAGYRLEEVSDEREAFAVICRRRLDLVLSGIDVSGARGVDACRELRARTPHLRIVVVREDHRPEDEEVALDAGADHRISAPIRFRDLWVVSALFFAACCSSTCQRMEYFKRLSWGLTLDAGYFAGVNGKSAFAS